MKCISIRQPWASAIVILGKDVENRSWPTRFRGRILVQASRKIDLKACEELGIDPASLVTGAIVGSVEISGCQRNFPSKWADPGSWHWTLQSPEAFRNPIPQLGRLGFFEVPEALLLKTENQ
jgi:hypothetical protein